MKKSKFKLKLWPADAESTAEKVFYAGTKIAAVSLFLIMFLSQLGVGHNLYSKSVAAAAPFWHIFGFLLEAGSIAWLYGMIKDKNYVTKDELGNAVILFFGFAFSFAAWGGFVFNG